MAYTKYSLTPANNTATPPDGAPEGMLPSAVNDTMRDMMAQIRDCGDGIRDGTYTMTAPKITGGTITGAAFTGNTFTSPVISGGTINNAVIGGSTAAAGTFTSLSDSGNLTFTGTGNRITGDFSNATSANRVLLQTSTTNGNTRFGLIPNGTSVISAFDAHSTADPTNSSRMGFAVIGGSESRITSDALGSGTNLPITMYTGGSERLRIDTSGNVGIGVTPSAWQSGASVLQIGSRGGLWQGAAGGVNVTNNTFVNSSGVTTYITTNAAASYNQSSAGDHIWSNAPSGTAGNTITFTERMRIDSSGNVGVGTTTINDRLVVQSSSAEQGITIRGDGFDAIKIAMVNPGTSNDGVIGMKINNALRFITNNTERMRITSGGVLMVGTTGLPAENGSALSLSGTGRVARIYGTTESLGALTVDKSTNTNTTSQIFVQFSINAQQTGNGQINGNGASQAAFGSFSDRRLKENIVDLPSQLSKIMALRPVEFDYIESEGGGHQISFIAQEFEEVYPDAIGERADGMKTLTGWGKTEAILVKAIQEQQAMIEELKQEVALLKSK